MTHVTEINKKCIIITSGCNSITLVPGIGGRITSFKNNNFEFLAGRDIHPDNFGSTFWPGPQSLWNWPPPKMPDKNPYSCEEKGDLIIMKSNCDPITGFQFIKEFSAGENGTFNITYKMLNASCRTLHAAPWEITRVKKGGLFFFPIGERTMRQKQFQTADYGLTQGIAWYKDELQRPNDYKLNIADGLEGWMAYLLDKKLFIKKFPDVTAEVQAPGEAEILFYISYPCSKLNPC